MFSKNSLKISQSMAMSANLIWILLFCYLCGLGRAEQPYCSKIDFNQPTVSGFRECTGQYAPMFLVKKYVDTPRVQPFRPSSEYYVSNGVEGYSCAESDTTFHLNAYSEIEAAIYLRFFIPGAFVDILIKDMDTKRTVNRWRSETSGGWFVFTKKIGVNVQNALIEIRTNANKNSRLAIEYIYVLNSGINLDECSRTPVEPTVPPTEETDPTDTTESTSDATPTEQPTAEPSEGDQLWKIIGIVIGVILFLLLLLLVIFLIIRHRKRKLLVVAPHVQSNDPNNYGTLPRLRIVNDKVSGVSIVGGGSDNNNAVRNSNANYPN